MPNLKKIQFVCNYLSKEIVFKLPACAIVYKNSFMKIILTLFFLLGIGSCLIAQNDPCTCSESFQRMQEKLEANYIAYALTKDKIAPAYTARKLKYNQLAAKTPLSQCTRLMQEFLGFFKDGHLFVSEFPKLPDSTLARHKTWIKAQKINNPKVNSISKVDIEGYWTDGTSSFALVKNLSSKIPYDYLAVTISAPDSSKIGEIKMGLTLSKGLWEGVYYTNAYTPRYVNVKAFKENQLLSIWGGFTWGRIKNKNGLIYDPVLPLVRRLDEETILLSLPSFLIEKSKLDQVLMAHFQELTETPKLIIDLRGNTGGNGIYFDLLSLFYEKSAPSELGFALSSEDNLNYFKKFVSPQGSDPYTSVVKAMEATPGKIVPGPLFPALQLNPLAAKLKTAIILTDRGNMSAAETFILSSKAISSKVITMGENTGGVVDYNNINMVSLGCATQGIYFGYPTFSFNQEVHLGKGFNQKGIAPDVRIDPKVVDKIGFALQYLKTH